MPEKYRRPHDHERLQAIEGMRREWEAQRGALATVRRFNLRLSAKGYSWFWPKIAAALTSKHHWLVACVYRKSHPGVVWAVQRCQLRSDR
jgi:hypothetical protein